MADGAVISFPAAVFESDDFGGSIVGHDFGDDLGSCNGRFSDLDLAVLDNKEDIGKLNRGTGSGSKAFNFKDLAFADLVLFASSADDGDVCHKRKRVSEKRGFGKSRIRQGAVLGLFGRRSGQAGHLRVGLDVFGIVYRPPQ